MLCLGKRFRHTSFSLSLQHAAVSAEELFPSPRQRKEEGNLSMEDLLGKATQRLLLPNLYQGSSSELSSPQHVMPIFPSSIPFFFFFLLKMSQSKRLLGAHLDQLSPETAVTGQPGSLLVQGWVCAGSWELPAAAPS